MAAPLVAGLTRMLSFQDIKKETKKIAKSKVSPKTESENKKISKKSGLLSSKEDKVESKISKTNSGDGEENSTFTGTSRKLSIKSASNSLSQIEQLKINVTNIHKFLVKSNNQYLRLQSTNKKILVREESKKRLQRKEGKLEKKTSPIEKSAGIMIGSIPGQSIFDKIFEFATLILAGIIVNALPEIIKKVKEIIDNIVNFLTPIQSGFNLIKAFFTDEIDQVKYDADKKRVDDALEKINGEGGLIDQIAEKTGPLEGLIKKLKPAIEGLRIGVGGKNMVLAKKGGKEGVLNKETGEFTERQFTAGERQQYEKQTIQADKFLDDPKGISGSELVITSEMGMRDFALSPGMHMGVDIAGPEGTPLVAFSKGEVNAVGYDGGYGNYVVWTDDKQIEHFYGHMKNPSPVKVGQSLTKGQVIGLMGSTGRSSGPHLHWETSTVTGDTGRSKNAVLSRFNPLSKYDKNAPFKIEKIKKTSKSSTGKGGEISAKIPGKMISTINQSMDDEDSMTIAIQQVNTIQTAYVPMPIPIRSKSMGSTPSTLSPLWSA